MIARITFRFFLQVKQCTAPVLNCENGKSIDNHPSTSTFIQHNTSILIGRAHCPLNTSSANTQFHPGRQSWRPVSTCAGKSRRIYSRQTQPAKSSRLLPSQTETSKTVTIACHRKSQQIAYYVDDGRDECAHSRYVRRAETESTCRSAPFHG